MHVTSCRDPKVHERRCPNVVQRLSRHARCARRPGARTPTLDPRPMILVRPSGADTGRRTALTEFITQRGTIGRCDAALCALYWLQTDGGRDDGATGQEIATLYPLHGKRRMTGMAYLLASLTRAGLAESVAKGWYRITPLGRSVVEVLPDVAMAAQLRGVRVRRASRRDQLGH